MPIRAVIFDRDDTLIRFDIAALDALEARLLSIAPSLPRGAAGALWDTWPHPWPRSDAEEPAFWSQFWHTLTEHYGLTPQVEQQLQAIGAFYHTCFVAFPDTIPCIQTLRACGFQLGVLTNFELPSVARTLTYAGIDPSWFTVLLSSSALGIRKPDIRAYLAAAAALGVSPHECVFVDDLVPHIEAAQAAGMRGILIDRNGTSVHDIETVSDLLTLVKVLTKIDTRHK
jgi:putative hydrolase of the HAD superfamily